MIFYYDFKELSGSCFTKIAKKDKENIDFFTYPSIGPAEQLQGGSRPRSSSSCLLFCTAILPYEHILTIEV